MLVNARSLSKILGKSELQLGRERVTGLQEEAAGFSYRVCAISRNKKLIYCKRQIKKTFIQV